MNIYEIRTTLKKHEKYDRIQFKSRDIWSAKNTARHIMKLNMYDAKRYFATNKIRIVML